ncbi:hypothetical protein MCOR02_005033 [Pyricularia oryzae]|nr:hypothetical protein MCOR02_005033 [Pyricularia oryzae]
MAVFYAPRLLLNRRVRYGRSLHGNGGDADLEAGACPDRPRVDEESNKYDGPMDITIGTEDSDSPKVEAPNVVAIRCEVRTSSFLMEMRFLPRPVACSDLVKKIELVRIRRELHICARAGS